MMIHLFTFFAFSRIYWENFTTEQALLDACSLCNKIVHIYNHNSSIIPNQDSECANKASKNKYCRFIEDVKASIFQKFGQAKIPRNACMIIGPCVSRVSQKRNGTNCFQCRFLSIHLKAMPSEARMKYLSNFCTSANRLFGDFCYLLEEGRKEAFLNGIQKYKNPTAVCDTSGFCHPKGYISAYKKLGNIIFRKKHEEL